MFAWFNIIIAIVIVVLFSSLCMKMRNKTTTKHLQLVYGRLLYCVSEKLKCIQYQIYKNKKKKNQKRKKKF